MVWSTITDRSPTISLLNRSFGTGLKNFGLHASEDPAIEKVGIDISASIDGAFARGLHEFWIHVGKGTDRNRNISIEVKGGAPFFPTAK
jgi:hypothetical protein